MLRNLPVDEIKIDKTFVSRMASEEQDRAIVRLLIDMCSTLGLFLVAEGVETEEQYRLHSGMGLRRLPGLSLRLGHARLPVQQARRGGIGRLHEL